MVKPKLAGGRSLLPADGQRSSRRGNGGIAHGRCPWDEQSVRTQSVRPQHSCPVTKTRRAESDTAKITAINAFAHYLLTRIQAVGLGGFLITVHYLAGDSVLRPAPKTFSGPARFQFPRSIPSLGGWCRHRLARLLLRLRQRMFPSCAHCCYSDLSEQRIQQVLCFLIATIGTVHHKLCYLRCG